MFTTIYSKTLFNYMLDSSALTAEEARDLQLVRGACGFFGAGTAAQQAAVRLAQAGVDVHWQADGSPRIYLRGTLI